MSIEIKRSDKYVDYNISAENNRGYITIDTSDWINKPWMFYELPALKFEIYTETNGELVKYQNFTREIRTYNPVYSPLGVLNVTIDIRNVPEEFILRITPIFDNDAIAARNMLIENGIENGDIWGSDRGVPTQLFNLDLEFIECEGEYIPPTPPVPPTHEETITGIPPITFDGSTGDPLVSWTILGNGKQTGTPSPDNIIMPEFVGVKTGNLVDFEAWLIRENVPYTKEGNSYTITRLLNKLLAPYYFSDTDIYVSISGVMTIPTGSNIRIYIVKRDGTISGSVALGGNSNIRQTLNVLGAGIKFDYASMGTCTVDNLMLNSGNTALPYEPFGYKIPISCGGENLLDESASSDADATHINYNKTAPIILTAGQTYTFSCDTTCNGLYIRNAADDSNLASANNSSTLTYTPQANVSAYFRVWNSNGITNLKPMLNLGSTAKPYAPYSRQTTPVYLGQVSTVRKIRKLVLTGKETFTKNNEQSTQYLYYANRGSILPHSIGRTPILCNELPVTSSAPQYGIGVNADNAFSVLYFNFGADVMNAQPSGNTVAGLKEYLAAQYAAGTPVTVWYVLATPTTGIVNEPLAKIGDYADELHSTDAGVSIPTAKGQNTLTVDTDLQPSEMTITYIKEGQ